MAGLTDNIGLLFKIKADSSDASREFTKVQAGLRELGTAGTTAGAGLGAMVNPTVLATAAIDAIGTAAIVAAAATWRLLNATAEYGSEIFDASQKTGLGAETLSALRFAAEQSGSSFEAVTGSVSKFNVLLGEAALGNEKAQKTLATFNITAKDTQGALEQAIRVIASETDVTKQAAAAKLLFKDRTAAILPIIKSFDGDLPKLIAKLKELGVTLTDEDVRAADEFGDTLDLLGKQAAATGRQFALGLMPAVTHAMQSMSSSMQGNASVARSWGEALGGIVSGVENYFRGLSVGVAGALAGFNRALGINLGITINWAATILASINPILYALYQLRSIMGGAAAQIQGTTDSIIGQLKVSSLPRISSGGKGGGGGGGPSAQDIQDKEFREAQERQNRINELYKAGYAQQIAENDRKLAAMEISEMEHAETVAGIKLAELETEKRLNEELLQLKSINAEKREEIEHKIGLLASEIYEQQIKNETDLTKARNKALDEAAAQMRELDELAEEFHQKELDRIEKQKKARAERAAKEFEARRREVEEAARRRAAITGIGTGGTDQFGQLIQVFRDNQAAIAGIEAARIAFEGLAQAIGQAVQAWILYGSVGRSARQVTAQIIAAIAQQAAVKAIFELAEGFAALARGIFGNPKGFAEATMHFKSAATYGIVAGVAAAAGRAVAGNAFNQATGGASTGSTGTNSSGQQQNNFTTPFQGFENKLNSTLNRLNLTLAQHEETVHRFDQKFGVASAQDVVMAGAGGASRAIVGAVNQELSGNPAAVDGTLRAMFSS